MAEEHVLPPAPLLALRTSPPGVHALAGCVRGVTPSISDDHRPLTLNMVEVLPWSRNCRCPAPHCRYETTGREDSCMSELASESMSQLPARSDVSCWAERARRATAMSMEMQAWTSLYHAMHAQRGAQAVLRATLRRIAGFARPHRRRLAVFLVLSVVGAVLAVATPVLAGRVVDAIVRGGERPRWSRLAGADRRHRGRRGRARASDAVALRADRRGPDPRPAHGGVRPRPAHADRVLHPHPHRRAGQPAQQRRDRGAAGVQRHAVRRRRATSSRWR